MGLGRLVDRAKAANEVRGLEVGRDKIEISHIQFADDTLFFVKTKFDENACFSVNYCFDMFFI